MKMKAIILLIMVLGFQGLAAAQQAEPLAPIIHSMDQAQKGMTLWQMLAAGGFIMIALLALSVTTLAIVIFDFLTFKEVKLVPRPFADEVIQKLERKDRIAVQELCGKNDNIISKMVREGLAKKGRGSLLAKEAMENVARKEIAGLWQNISYLSDIATVSPLMGLLGTVFGMIQAFNAVAFQTGAVKPILLAAGIAKAMITTAGGLCVAIPALIFYSILRGRVQLITNAVENYSADIVKLVSEIS